MKRILIASMILVSSLVLAKPIASDSLVSVLPVGTYLGKTDLNESCQIYINFSSQNANQLEVVAQTNSSSVSYLVDDQSDYATGRVGKQNVLFLQSNIVEGNTLGSIKIINTHNGLKNVSVGEYTIENRERSATEVSCNI